MRKTYDEIVEDGEYGSVTRDGRKWLVDGREVLNCDIDFLHMKSVLKFESDEERQEFTSKYRYGMKDVRRFSSWTYTRFYRDGVLVGGSHRTLGSTSHFEAIDGVKSGPSFSKRIQFDGCESVVFIGAVD